ncbi:hypothetical protein PF1082 [Pyrococcus furiosus DSM 3638]|uniref:Uncharacterized protein n=1 Tax=Pyrococcus furiosus (strain ATCC 43587 / DSM 3638 / JCM 8422 / Vc1) TaxID=186497 RepID=Q8U1X2_PYRFU|nr:hypothetical protein PF1082 [Pyrococcus furiosus DSM 3638]
MRSTALLTIDTIEYFKPATFYGVITSLLRFLSLIFPESYTIRIILEQGVLLVALAISYYKLGTILSRNTSNKYLAYTMSIVAGIITCLLFPPPL